VPAGHSIRLEITNRGGQDIDSTNGHTPELDQLRYMPFVEYSENRVFFDAVRPSSITIPLIDAAALSFSVHEVPAIGGIGSLTLGLLMLGLSVVRLRKK
jgi:hypothetical protein